MPENARVLIVEPNEDHRLLFAEILRREGFGVPHAVEGNPAALQALESAGDAFDAALIAIRPGDDAGAELCRRIKADARWRDIPVLFVAAQGEPHYVALAYEAGALDYLRKPIDRNELRVRLRAAVGLRAEIRTRRDRERSLTQALDTLRADLDAAASLQRSLLPPPYLPGGATIAHAFRFVPCDRLGGDMLDVLALPDGRTAFYVLDVAGHGVKAALQCVGYHRLLSVERAGGILLDASGRARPPGEVVEELNQLVAAAGAEGDYLTMIYAIADPASGELEVCQAGHPRMVLVRKGGCEAFQPADLPVGVFARTGYQTHRVRLEAGTRIAMYTDGITEAMSPAGEQYGAARLVALLMRTAMLDVESAVSALLAEVQDWTVHSAIEDDISALILELPPR